MEKLSMVKVDFLLCILVGLFTKIFLYKFLLGAHSDHLLHPSLV